MELSFFWPTIRKSQGLSYCTLCLCPACSICQLYCKLIFEIFNKGVNIYWIIYQYMCKYILHSTRRRRRRMGIWTTILCRFCQYNSSLRTPCRPGSYSTFPCWIFTTNIYNVDSYWYLLIYQVQIRSIIIVFWTALSLNLGSPKVDRIHRLCWYHPLQCHGEVTGVLPPVL